MSHRTIALCLDRGGVPHLEPELAFDVIEKTSASSTCGNNNPKTFVFAGSYFDVFSILSACKATKRDALTEMGLRSFISKFEKDQQCIFFGEGEENKNKNPFSSLHILIPRSPLFSCSVGLPTAEAGPSSDQHQGRLQMTVEKWKEIVSVTKPDVAAPLCELASIPELFCMGSRKKQVLSARNQKWLEKILGGGDEDSSTSAYSTATDIIFPLITQFIVVKNKTDNENKEEKQQQQSSSSKNETSASASAAGDDDAAATTTSSSSSLVITIDEDLYCKWSKSDCAFRNKRYVGIFCLGSGEDSSQRISVLEQTAELLEKAETNFREKHLQSQGEKIQIPPLTLIVGNVNDFETIQQVEQVFLKKNNENKNNNNFIIDSSNIIYISAAVPTTLASRGMALQQQQNISSSSSETTQKNVSISKALSTSSSLASAATASGRSNVVDETNNKQTESARRAREDEDTNSIMMMKKSQVSSCEENSSNNNNQEDNNINSKSLKVINLWDTDFKFCRDPLYCASTQEKVSEDNKNNNNTTNICPCMPCERHTAGYLHHLLDVHEMNSEILLSIHNWTEWIRYLKREKQ